MRDEIEKLIAELRSDPESFWNQNDAADHLQRILDADPVARLEAMGSTFIVQQPTGAMDDEGSEIVLVELGFWNKERQLALSTPLAGEVGKFSEVLRDAATRLLARIEEARDE